MRPSSSVQWTAYPALIVAGAFAAGIIGASVFEPQSLVPWIIGAGGGLVGFVAAEWWHRTRLVTLAPFGRVVAVVLVAGCAGGARSTVYQAPSPRSLAPAAEASDGDTTVQGSVEEAPERTDEATRFVLAVDSILGTGGSVAAEGRVRVTLKPSPWSDQDGTFPEIYQGDVVRLRGSLRSAPGLRNPGGFDYGAYLSRRGICCTLYVGDSDRVTVLGSERGAVQGALVSVRSYIGRQIRRYVPSDRGRAVLRALLLGDRSRITDAQRDRFAKTGLMHLLAVSGLHVFLVGMVLYALLRPLLVRIQLRWRTVEIVRAVLTVVVLGFYMLLTGSRPSVVRAVIMATLFIGGVFFQRSAHSLNTLGVAALVLLALRPPMLFDVGFQLSMAAVAGIVTLNPRFLDAIPDEYQNSQATDWVVSTATASAAAILGTAPILLYHFGWVSVAGLLLNMVGIPYTGLGLSSAIVAVATGGVSTALAAPFGSAADVFMQGLLSTSGYGASWFSWAGVRMPVPDLWALGAVGAGLIALAQWPRPRIRWRWIAAGLLFAVVSVWNPVLKGEATPTLDVIFFDVGQGDAILVKTPLDRHMLVDTGPRSPNSAAVEFAVLPFLEQWGIRKLDIVAITHSDEDHLGGLPALLKEVSVGQVVHNGMSADTELYAETFWRLREKDIPHQAVQREDTLNVGPSLSVDVLGPPSQAKFHGENDMSVVLKLEYGMVDILLPGDVEADAERRLVRTYGRQLGSHVVKIPHHGSATSSTPGFVQAASVSEKTNAVASVGQENQYSMPSETALRRWRESGTDVYSTARDGAVWMRTDGEDAWRIRWK